MDGEREFIARVEAADPTELAEILRRLSAEEGRILAAYFGDDRLQSMRDLALQAAARRAPTEVRGNVVVIPGVMGSELATFDADTTHDLLWVSYRRLFAGQIDRLRLAEDGLGEGGGALQVRPIGIMKKYYGELMLDLHRAWNVKAFFYDWRKDVGVAAEELRSQITGWFGDDAPVHLVAHSLGGLVARAFVLRHPERWNKMQDPTGDPARNIAAGTRGGRLIMLGTPNSGAFAIVQAIVGIEGLIRTIAKFDLRHNQRELAQITNTFVSTYQMLPTPGGDATLAELYKERTYPGFGVSARHLEAAFRHQSELAKPIAHPNQVFYVAGANQPTLSALPDAVFPDDLARLTNQDAYGASFAGDGRVLHERGTWRGEDGTELPDKRNWYYVEEVHADLARNPDVRVAVDDLLATGNSERLPQMPPTLRAGGDVATQRYLADQQAADQEAERMAQRLQPRAFGRGTTFVAGPSVERGASDGVPPSTDGAGEPFASNTADEAKLRDLLFRGRIDDPTHRYRGTVARASEPRPRIEIRLVPGEIEALEHTALADVDPQVDAIGVGHYLGVRPQNAELALDRAISLALCGADGGDDPGRDDYVLTQFTDRQTFVGELGRPFFLDDPRVDGRRVVAIAGMGHAGGFGRPELVVLARELCWSLGRLGKRHLATILIGAGSGNIPAREAIQSWLDGIGLGLRGWEGTNDWRLDRVTFVVRNPITLGEVHRAIADQKQRLADRLDVDYDRDDNDPDPRRQIEKRKKAVQRLQADWKTWDDRRDAAAKVAAAGRDADPGKEQRERAPTRLTLKLDGQAYRFSVITETASVPERDVVLDQDLVEEANDELAREFDPVRQRDRGIFLERLLLPAEFRTHLASDAPLVMLLDSRTARIHWEMVAQPDPASVSRDAPAAGGPAETENWVFDPYRFLGTARGFTRQLTTTFAPPPEPPPPPRRRLRALVVADPADDASLPGAELEGLVVADLLEAFNRFAPRVGEGGANAVEVVRLFGPSEATLTNVLRELMVRPYDIFHFAGHSFYNTAEPTASGFVFHRNPLRCLTARELNRIDRVPRFVFSNACESGVTQDRIDKRHTDLPPSFAEAFFARGVANFVCTAWPVDDLAARLFATRLYAGLLGLQVDDDGRAVGLAEPLPMHRAMQEARVHIALQPMGAQTWGAYQHYGNPYFRFFAPRTETPASSGARARRSSKRRAQQNGSGSS